jgi:hypothetical protein
MVYLKCVSTAEDHVCGELKAHVDPRVGISRVCARLFMCGGWAALPACPSARGIMSWCR